VLTAAAMLSSLKAILQTDDLPLILHGRTIMRKSIDSLFGPVGDDRHNDCVKRCEAELSRYSNTYSARAKETCERNYQDCVDVCDHEEGIVKVLSTG
jgi:hypothetical protein